MHTGIIRRRWLLTFLQSVIFPFLIAAAPPYPEVSESYFNGKITYERHVHWKDIANLSYGTMTTTVDLDETLTVLVNAGYLRDSYGSQLYEASPLSGKSVVSMTKTVLITENDGDWNKTIDTWKGEGSLDPEDSSNLLLTIDTREKTYTMSAAIFCPVVNGTTEITDSKGSKMTSEAADSWRLNASFDMDGITDGNLVKGSWSDPAIRNQAVTPQTGLLPGTSWEWSLNRSHLKNK